MVSFGDAEPRCYAVSVTTALSNGKLLVSFINIEHMLFEVISNTWLLLRVGSLYEKFLQFYLIKHSINAKPLFDHHFINYTKGLKRKRLTGL